MEWLLQNQQVAERMSLSIEGRIGAVRMGMGGGGLLIENGSGDAVETRAAVTIKENNAGADTAAVGAGVRSVLGPVWAQEIVPAWENVTGSHFSAEGGVLEKKEGSVLLLSYDSRCSGVCTRHFALLPNGAMGAMELFEDQNLAEWRLVAAE